MRHTRTKVQKVVPLRIRGVKLFPTNQSTLEDTWEMPDNKRTASQTTACQVDLQQSNPLRGTAMVYLPNYGGNKLFESAQSSSFPTPTPLATLKAEKDINTWH